MKRHTAVNISIRPNPEDRKLLDALVKKLGVKPSELVRLALRALAAKEGVSL
jgi:hypothetical protein